MRTKIAVLFVPASISFAATSRASLQAQITTLSTTTTSSSAEVDALKHRIEDTEREKRELVTVVSRLKEDGAQREGMLLRSTSGPMFDPLSLQAAVNAV